MLVYLGRYGQCCDSTKKKSGGERKRERNGQSRQVINTAKSVRQLYVPESGIEPLDTDM